MTAKDWHELRQQPWVVVVVKLDLNYWSAGMREGIVGLGVAKGSHGGSGFECCL
jgi:hypothetical protein